MNHHDPGFEFVFWLVAGIIVLNVIASDIAAGRLADPFKLFGA